MMRTISKGTCIRGLFSLQGSSGVRFPAPVPQPGDPCWTSIVYYVVQSRTTSLDYTN